MQSRIDEFLKSRWADGDLQPPDDSDTEGPDAGQWSDPPNKKRKHESDPPVSANTSKVAPWEVGELEVDLTGSRKIVVSKFKGKLYVSASVLISNFFTCCMPPKTPCICDVPSTVMCITQLA